MLNSRVGTGLHPALPRPNRPYIKNPKVSHFDIEASDRTGRAKLYETVYTLVPPPGMDFDESAVRAIRSQWDPGFIPFHRKMIFKSVLGSWIVCHNWGVCRYSEHGVQNELLRVAQRPMSGYFSTLEHPTDVDGIYPFGIGMSNDGLPAPYEPFNGPMVMDHCRRVYGEARRKYMEREREREEDREKRLDSYLDEANEKFKDQIPRSDWSTAVRPTPVAHQIKPGESNVAQHQSL